MEEQPFGEEKTLGEEIPLCLCKLVEEEHCGEGEGRGKTEPTHYIFLKCFSNSVHMHITHKALGRCLQLLYYLKIIK